MKRHTVGTDIQTEPHAFRVISEVPVLGGTLVTQLHSPKTRDA